MGGGGGGGGSNLGLMFQIMEAQQARQREEQRQARISSGREQIDKAFSGIDDSFYNRYGTAVQDYYKPQLAKQYADANKELTYRLADAGTLRSTAANELAADLSQQNDMNVASLNSKADMAKADLRNRVASEKTAATNQLYATEDPQLAADAAMNGVKQINLAQPDLTPLANVFNVATVGAANAMKAWQNQGLQNYAAGGSPQASSPFASSGSYKS